MLAKETTGKSLTVSSGPIEKVKEFWSNLTLTSSSDSKDREKAVAAESEDKRIQIKVMARKDTVTNKESCATASNSEGSSSDTQTFYMPIHQASDGKTAEAIVVNNEKGANKADVDVKDVKIVEK